MLQTPDNLRQQAEAIAQTLRAAFPDEPPPGHNAPWLWLLDSAFGRRRRVRLLYLQKPERIMALLMVMTVCWWVDAALEYRLR